MTGFATRAAFEAALADLPPPDAAIVAQARERQAQLTKPAGSLGRLEEIAIFMAGWQRRVRPRLETVQAIVFAGEHGVATRGVSAFPPEVTRQMVANFNAGGAAINALSRACGAALSVVDLTGDGPSGDITEAPAMDEAECLAALSAGANAVNTQADLLLVGEMGIGNTTPASAICAQGQAESAGAWIGRGTGIDAEGLNRKRQAVDAALRLHGPHCASPFETLRRLGGREIAAMAGAILTARQRRIPVLLDGFICCAAIAPLQCADPAFTDHCLAGHCSDEHAHGMLLDRLGLRPLLRLDMRLGEGTGAAVAVQIVRSALAAHNEMATFAEAAVSGAR
ncbi:nicotinate-nucleotide--dimethylbenzimidazole phosphoribosyltransferase [Stakelama tenebrarum]|uniref:Nicotinate-nucleotide--dimethylbenzimidazole phosphoribosyltransferase n=1 Tax=Stakelama tenebrarum TaxID=2711215 RepID=A0A6G6Y2B1_9SPHN|nr:nicotinate-nucleotide--dimethylbenzimidazole phosphoribosyltransferase [Sphingosinithalassobacter tenebrarum]QIG79062.1 nicotinate-nucleotide--dimethylbenzimidazole phosphoribosyltransferase [Sphingosinithalassobacter tenebrarum]